MLNSSRVGTEIAWEEIDSMLRVGGEEGGGFAHATITPMVLVYQQAHLSGLLVYPLSSMFTARCQGFDSSVF